MKCILFVVDERRYYGQNVVYDNSLAGFPLNYFNYQQQQQQDYNSNGGGGHSKPSSYGGSTSGYAKPQYRSSAAAYTAPKNLQYGSAYPASIEYGAYMGQPAYNYVAGAGSASSPSAAGNGYYSLQYGY